MRGGLPTGVSYGFSGQNQQITLSGIPTAVGTYTYNIVYYNAQQLSNSSVVASVTGVLSILCNLNDFLNYLFELIRVQLVAQVVSGAQSLTTTVSTDGVLVRYDFTSRIDFTSSEASVTGLHSRSYLYSSKRGGC